MGQYYLIKERLEPCTKEFIHGRGKKSKYVANVTWEEFEQDANLFDMGIDIELQKGRVPVTMIEVNYDSLTGSFYIPSRVNCDAEPHSFSFAVDERGIVFINDDGMAQTLIDRILQTKHWKMPSLERFIYDFLEQIVIGDLLELEKYETEMEKMEDRIIKNDLDGIMERLVDIRSELIDLKAHYEQLIDVSQELEENENHFFDTKNLRFFRLFTERSERLLNIVTSLKEHSMQVRDLYHYQMEVNRNNHMEMLTILSAIFMPLTLITSWFGMNFVHMPELAKPWAYPVLIGVCVTIVLVNIFILKRKKWI